LPLVSSTNYFSLHQKPPQHNRQLRPGGCAFGVNGITAHALDYAQFVQSLHGFFGVTGDLRFIGKYDVFNSRGLVDFGKFYKTSISPQ